MSSMSLKYADPVTIFGTGPYPIPHEYGPSSEVKVTIQTSDNTLVEISNNDIILDPLESDTTGNLYISSSVATLYSGDKLYIRRESTVDQEWVSVRGKLQFALQNQLDLLSRAIQELQEKASRSVTVFNEKIPYIVPEARKTLIWNDEGTAFESGPSIEEIYSINTKILPTWISLLDLPEAVDGEGATVLDSDTGTHLDLTATGYDGASVPNAGTYSWVTAWNGWSHIGDTGLAGKVAYADGILKDPTTGGITPAEFDGNGTVIRWWVTEGDMYVPKGIKTPEGSMLVFPPSVEALPAAAPATVAGDGVMALTFDDQGRLVAMPSPEFARNVQIAAPPVVNTDAIVSKHEIVIWSDSMAANGSGWGPNLAGLFDDRSVMIFGNGGQKADQIAGRQGGVEVTINVSGGSIPASSSVAVPVKNYNILSDGGGYNGTQTGTIHGTSDVYGTMSTDTSGNWTFTRADAGTVVVVNDGSVFEPDTQNSYRAHTAIFVSGTNNMSTLAMSDVELQAVVDTNIAMVAHLSPLVKHFVFVATTGSYNSTGASIANMARFNLLMRDAVGDAHFIDMSDYMINRAIYEAVDDGLLASGTYPTTDDLSDISAGLVPRSLIVNGPHYSDIGKTMAAKHVRRQLLAKGY